MTATWLNTNTSFFPAVTSLYIIWSALSTAKHWSWSDITEWYANTRSGHSWINPITCTAFFLFRSHLTLYLDKMKTSCGTLRRVHLCAVSSWLVSRSQENLNVWPSRNQIHVYMYIYKKKKETKNKPHMYIQNSAEAAGLFSTGPVGTAWVSSFASHDAIRLRGNVLCFMPKKLFSICSWQKKIANCALEK